MGFRYKTWRQAPFDGMQDALDPTTANPTKALLLQNCYPVPGPAGMDVVGRPGFAQLGAQLGAGGNRRVQGFHQYTKLDGTEYTIAFCGGLMYTLDWATRVWANVPLVGVSLSTTAKVRCLTFANVMVVSDGVNRPWTYDGTTFVDLTNAPVTYGPPTVYYGKLFLVKNSDRRTFVWSEEYQPNVGYEAGGYNNAWQLGQTSSAALERLLGTNEALYYWRARSTGRITGAVTPDFVGSGTREGVSDTIGTTAPDAVVIYDDLIYFLSADGRPYRIPVAGNLSALWADLLETTQRLPNTKLGQALGAIYPSAVLVLLAVADLGQDECTMIVALDHRTGHIGGVWNGWTSTAFGTVRNTSQNVVLLHGSLNGYVYDHGNPDGSYWTDVNAAADGGTVAIPHAVTGTPLGYAVQTPKAWDRVDCTFRLLTDLTTLTFDYETPRGIAPLTPLSMDLTGASSYWDVAPWDAGLWSSESIERKVTFGVSGDGRWLRPRLRHQYTTERFALLAVEASGYLQPTSPETP